MYEDLDLIATFLMSSSHETFVTENRWFWGRANVESVTFLVHKSPLPAKNKAFFFYTLYYTPGDQVHCMSLVFSPRRGGCCVVQ